MAFTSPTQQQLFALQHFAGIADIAAHERFASADEEMVAAILEGIGALAAGEWAPLNHVGDANPAYLHQGKVIMPEGFDAAWRAYVDGGWAGVTASAQYGGQGMPFSIGLAVLEALGTANFAFALCPMLTLGAIEALHTHGTDAQKLAYLPKLARGEWTGTMNLTEAGAGSDVGALKTTAEPAGDGKWKIAGQKIFITFGDHDLAENIAHLVLARTPDAPQGTKGISLFLVPKYRLNADGSPGAFNHITPLKLEHKMGIHASPTCALQFGEGGDCLGELIGQENGGMRAMFTMMNNARINVGNQGLQIAERAYQQALAYAGERVQSPRAGSVSQASVAIIAHPDVRRMLMRMKAGIDAMRALNFYIAGQVDRAALGDEKAAGRQDLLTPIVKAYCTDLGMEITSLGVQIHGGMGYMEEMGAAQHYRDARIAPIYEGTNGIQAIDLVGRKLQMNDGALFSALFDDIDAQTQGEAALAALANDARSIADWMLKHATLDDRLAGASAYCTMMGALTCGWLMLRQENIAHAALAADEGDADFMAARAAAARFYLDHILPEALGLSAAIKAGSAGLYRLNEAQLMR